MKSEHEENEAHDSSEPDEARTGEIPITTGGVKIFGASPVSDVASATLFEGSDSSPAVDLPHWTDPPTGQLAATTGGAEAAPPTGPSWREDASDWEHEGQSLDSAMLTDEHAAVTESPEEKAERKPWDFDGDSPSTFSGRDEVFSADAYESLPSEEELFSSLGALSAAAVAGELVEDELRPNRRVRKLRRTSPEEPGEISADDRGEPAEVVPPAEVTEPVKRTRPRDLPATIAASTDAQHQRNLSVAMATGFGLGIVLLVAFDLGNVITGLAVAVVAVAGLLEGFSMFRSVGYRPATFLGFVVTLLTLWGAYNYGVQALPAMTLLLLGGSFAWYFLGADRDDPITGMGTTMLVFCWVGLSGAYGELLLNPALFPTRHGVAILLGVVLSVVANDVTALFVGRRLGRHQMAPRISPNKTWEGFLGGTLGTFVVSLALVSLVHPWTLSSAFYLALLTSVVAPMGDLAQSAIKRRLGLKDSGALLPGH
ncbi:MAG: phosphatidate cytidylyltransferase, partial [Actinomycetota bacterium]